jgi:hypothetical protein
MNAEQVEETMHRAMSEVEHDGLEATANEETTVRSIRVDHDFEGSVIQKLIYHCRQNVVVEDRTITRH